MIQFFCGINLIALIGKVDAYKVLMHVFNYTKSYIIRVVMQGQGAWIKSKYDPRVMGMEIDRLHPGGSFEH